MSGWAVLAAPVFSDDETTVSTDAHAALAAAGWTPPEAAS